MTKGWQKHTTLEATVKPTIKDLHWAAGYIEGEGYVSIAGGKKPSTLTEIVAVTSTDKEPVEKLLKLFGGNIYGPHPNGFRKDGSAKKVTYRWHVSGARARGIIMTLFVLLSPRRQEQIRKALQH